MHAARAHVVNVSLGVLVAVFKGALLLGLAPEDLIIAVGVEGRVNVNQIHAGIGQLGELFQIVAAIDDAGVEEGAWTTPHPGPLVQRGEGVNLFGGRAALLRRLPFALADRQVSPTGGRCGSFRAGNLFGHARSLKKLRAAVNVVSLGFDF